MGLIKLNNDENEKVPESEDVVRRKVDIVEPISNDTAQIVSRILAILENLSVDYIRIEKGKINYVYYPDYKEE